MGRGRSGEALNYGIWKLEDDAGALSLLFLAQFSDKSLAFVPDHREANLTLARNVCGLGYHAIFKRKFSSVDYGESCGQGRPHEI